VKVFCFLEKNKIQKDKAINNTGPGRGKIKLFHPVLFAIIHKSRRV